MIKDFFSKLFFLALVAFLLWWFFLRHGWEWLKSVGRKVRAVWESKNWADGGEGLERLDDIETFKGGSFLDWWRWRNSDPTEDAK